jgi:hypothetical protein
VIRRTWRELCSRERTSSGARRSSSAPARLDLFAVLLGGATALLPVYADQILHVGPIGFGWLRAAPSLGAFAMAMWIAHRPPLERPGRALLWAVAGFGVSDRRLRLIPLVLAFAPRAHSSPARSTTSVSSCGSRSCNSLTPDALRGRVTAVNQIFIGSSNEIGALRAGLMSALIGPVAAVVWGGIGTIHRHRGNGRSRSAGAASDCHALHTLRPEA